MKALKWSAREGCLAESLEITPERLVLIEDEARKKIDSGSSMNEFLNHMREFCISEEEFTAAVFGLGYMQGAIFPFGFKIKM